MQNHFWLRLPYCYLTIPEGQILLGTSITEPLGYWTRPTCISDIDVHKIDPYIFSVGTASSITENEKRNIYLFLSEFRQCEKKNSKYSSST
jgi:hypothetical protein